jgi:hypothetical protein
MEKRGDPVLYLRIGGKGETRAMPTAECGRLHSGGAACKRKMPIHVKRPYEYAAGEKRKDKIKEQFARIKPLLHLARSFVRAPDVASLAGG